MAKMNRYGQMGAASGGFAQSSGAAVPRPPKMAAPAPKAMAKPVKARRDMSANLGKHLHPKKAR